MSAHRPGNRGAATDLPVRRDRELPGRAISLLDG